LQAAGALVAELAYHALSAGLTEPAFHWSLLAGDEAMRVFAVHDALTFYEQARHLLAERVHGLSLLTMLPAPEVEHLYIHLGRAYELNAEWEKARTAYTSLLAYAREAGELGMESTILNRLAILAAQQSFDLAAAKRLLEEAWWVAEASSEPVILAETEWNLAQMAIHACKSKRALIHAERALERARVTSLKELTARSLYTLGLSYALCGYWEEVVTYAEEARILYAAIDDQAGEASGLSAQLIYAGSPPTGLLTKRAMEVLCLCLLALGHVNCGEPRAGMSAGQAAFDISLEIKNIWAQVYSVLNLNHALLEVGAYEQALRVTQQGVEMARTLPNPILLFFLLTALGAAHQAMLSLEEAHEALREALALSETIVVPSYQVLATSRLCANRALAGDWKSAYTYALEAVAVRKDMETALPFPDFLRYFEIEALLRGGEEERSRQEVQRLDASSRTTRRQRLPYLRALATLARWEGETREALASLQEAAVLAHEIGLPGELWQIEAALGEVYASSGQSEQAHQVFVRAMAIM
jgi:tetratricopeptide (TPR) repeat protein